MRAVASKTSDVAGDRTTTATVLAQAIFPEGARAITAGANPMDLKRGIKRATEVASDRQERTADDDSLVRQAKLESNYWIG